MDTFIQDLRYGFRLLRTRPGFVAVAVITLAVGIGANTAMFSMIDALVVRPLLFKDIDRQVIVWNRLPQRDRAGVSLADFVDYQSQATSFEQLAAYNWNVVNITGSGEPERVQGFQVTGNFFGMLGVNAEVGRFLTQEDDQAGHDRVVVLSDALWKRRFGADPNITEQTVRVDGRECSIVGVMPRDFNWPASAELWTPVAATPAQKSDRANHGYVVTGLLKPDVSVPVAQSEMDLIARRIAEQYPDTNAARQAHILRVPGQFSDDMVRGFLVILMAAVGFVLLIACSNVANLQLTRAMGRQKEIAIRLAIGAGRWRIIRQLLAESVTLSVVASAFGGLIALWGIDLMKQSLPADEAKFVTGLSHMSLNFRALAFNVAAALFAGIISGLAPALQTSRTDLNVTLKEGGKGTTTVGGRRRLRNALVIGEVALALVLLIGTGLMVDGFARLANGQKTGFDPSRILTAGITLGGGD